MPGPRILIRGGSIHDGSGAPPYVADVLIEGGRIADIGQLDVDEVEVIEAVGLIVAPGFIDVHSHSDYTLFVDPRAVSAVFQGVTLEIVGNCGHGCAPRISRRHAGLAVYGPIHCQELPPPTMGGYLDALGARKPAVNVMMLVPNGQLRLGVVGLAPRSAMPGEQAEMGRQLQEGLDAGAFGYSTGLEYAQEKGASEDEVVELAAIAARAGGFYATHTRDRDAGADDAVAEAIRIGERADVQVQVSHITPRSGEAAIEACLERVGAARRRGVRVGFDMHTRVFGFTHLKNIVPAEALEGSADQVRARFLDPANRTMFHAHGNLITGVGDWEKVVLVRSSACPELEGLSFAEIGRREGKEPLDCALQTLAADAGDLLVPMVILLTYTEEQLRRTYREPGCMIGSDATALAPDGPLANEIFYGAYTWAAWFWRRMVRESRTFTPEEAIHRLTGLPAETFAIKRRGMLRPGMQADVVVFDPKLFGERGTLSEPNLLSEGMLHVFVNGVATLQDGVLTGDRAGEVLRRPG